MPPPPPPVELPLCGRQCGSSAPRLMAWQRRPATSYAVQRARTSGPVSLQYVIARGGLPMRAASRRSASFIERSRTKLRDPRSRRHLTGKAKIRPVNRVDAIGGDAIKPTVLELGGSDRCLVMPETWTRRGSVIDRRTAEPTELTGHVMYRRLQRFRPHNIYDASSTRKKKQKKCSSEKMET